MATLSRLLLIVAGLCTLSACGSDAVEEQPTEAERQQALRDSAFGSLTEQMDRAAEVQRLQLDRKREIDAVLDQ